MSFPPTALAAHLRQLREHALVSDHALVRWLERVHGYDMDRVREEILTPATLIGIEKGAARVHRPDLEITLVLRRGCVVTVLPGVQRIGPAQEQPR